MAQEYRHIIRISGTDLDGSKKVEYGLTKIKGIGSNLSKIIVQKANFSGNLRIGNLTDVEVQKLEDILNNPRKYDIPGWMLNRRKDLDTGEDLHLIGPDLTLRMKSDIGNMIQIRSWKGIRHSFGLKVRGQRTKTTGRTGRAVGVKKKELRAPTTPQSEG